ncbi:antibiotic biosynthesis monooxygenase family protein [Hahella ganghwensis]|uniref:antibiotic biosynthesis monooxygenase family protein n=1 Tax=Hahella ganghwensis TaxID=286420 RepID=UPI0003826BE1|nr:hypothetical protein [Hahella ganghwensis]
MSGNTADTNVVEMVTFKLLAGTTEQDFLAANEGIQQFVKQQPGFLYRSLCKLDGEEEWTDIVYWQNLAAAETAGKDFMESPLSKPALSCIDPDSVTMRHLPVVTNSCSIE